MDFFIIKQKVGIGQPSANTRAKDKKYRPSLSEGSPAGDPLSLPLAVKEQNMVSYTMNRNAKGSINRMAFVCLLGSFAHLWKHCEKVQAHYHLSKNICISVNGCHIVDTAALHVLFFESHDTK